MQQKITGIVIDIRHHNDSNDVITLFTREYGRMSFISSAGATPAGRRRRARLQPLSVIEAQIHIVAGKELQLLRSFDMAVITPDLYYNPYKRSVAIFLAEFLNKLLRASAPDSEVFDLLMVLIKTLDTTNKSVANFHIATMMLLLRPMGIEPAKADGAISGWFDMRSGEFSPFRPTHKDTLSPHESETMALLFRISLHNWHLYRLSRQNRQRIISLLLKYYSLHFPGTSTLNSPEILSEIF